MYRQYATTYKWYLVFTIALVTMSLAACSSAKDIIYLDDMQPNITIKAQDPRPIKLMPGDKITVSVHSRDKELVEMFNLSSIGDNGGSYTIDSNGKIEMPIIGNVHVKGLTRLELQNIIRYKLLASKLVRDPIVSVEYVDLAFYTLGELEAGRHTITRDVITIMEAIAESGDINLDGRRDNIFIIRSIDGQHTPYEINVTKVDDVYSSPVYYLQQNDIIYVKPSDRKLNSTTPFGDAIRTPTFWLGMFNTALSLLLMFSK